MNHTPVREPSDIDHAVLREPVMEPREFRIVFRALRMRHGLTLYRLAKRMGYTPGYLSRLESGSRYPTYLCVQRCASEMHLHGEEREALFLAAGFVPPEERAQRLAQLWSSVVVREGNHAAREGEHAAAQYDTREAVGSLTPDR